MYDKVRIYFNDGSTTVIYVSEDDDITDAIVELCELEGWTLDVIDYAIEQEPAY